MISKQEKYAVQCVLEYQEKTNRHDAMCFRDGIRKGLAIAANNPYIESLKNIIPDMLSDEELVKLHDAVKYLNEALANVTRKPAE